MTLRDDLNALTPRLRRYARALTTGHSAPSNRADDLVHATLMRALGARTIGSSADLVVRLYATVTQLHRDMAMAGTSAVAAGAGRPSLVSGEGSFPRAARQTKLSAAMLSLSLDEREALLLVALEGFDHGEAARILRISRGALLGRLTLARTALDRHLKAPSIQTRSLGPSVPSAAKPLHPRPSEADFAGSRQRLAPHLRLVT